MWSPDIRTIFLLIFLTDAFLTIMILTYWRTQKTYDGFALWAVCLLFQALAYLLFMLRGEVSAFLSIPVANVLTIAAIIMRTDAIRRFLWARPLSAGYYSLLVPVFASYWYFTFVDPSILLRNLISTLFIAPFLIASAFLALSSRERESRVLRSLFAVSLVIPALLILARFGAWLILPGEHTLFDTDTFNLAFFIVAMLADILATGFFLMLNMVRSDKELRLTNAKLNLLSGITRHDIRNQLHALSGLLELSEQVSGEPGRTAELIAKEKMITQTITHQINFTGDYQNLGIAAPAWQNVGAIVFQAAATLPVKDVRISVDRDDLELYADPLLGKVFYNLLDNALRYGGSGISCIRIGSRETAAGLVVTFEDDGVGIDPGDRKHLFERGFGKNTGLGLFLSREILSITDITIRETSEPGRGARFELIVPAGGYRFAKQ